MRETEGNGKRGSKGDHSGHAEVSRIRLNRLHSGVHLPWLQGGKAKEVKYTSKTRASTKAASGPGAKLQEVPRQEAKL